MISTPRVGLEFNKGWLDYLVQILSKYSDSVKDDYPDMYYTAQKLIYDIDKYRVEIPKNGHNVDYVDLPEPEVSDVIFIPRFLMQSLVMSAAQWSMVSLDPRGSCSKSRFLTVA